MLRMCNRIVDAAVLAAVVGVDRLVEASLRAVVGGDDLAGLLRGQRRLQLLRLGVLQTPAVVVAADFALGVRNARIQSGRTGRTWRRARARRPLRRATRRLREGRVSRPFSRKNASIFGNLASKGPVSTSKNGENPQNGVRAENFCYAAASAGRGADPSHRVPQRGEI